MFQSRLLRMVLVYVMSKVFSMWLDMHFSIPPYSVLDWALFFTILLGLLWVFIFTWEEEKK